MKASELKQIIIDLIGEKIGMYRQGNIKAIWVGNAPYNQMAEGLEVWIPSFPEFVNTGNRLTSERWSIHLAQFPQENGQETIYEAMETLREGLIPHPKLTFIDRPNPNDNPIGDLPFLPTAVLRYELAEVWRN